jgi:hypothetical protein
VCLIRRGVHSILRRTLFLFESQLFFQRRLHLVRRSLMARKLSCVRGAALAQLRRSIALFRRQRGEQLSLLRALVLLRTCTVIGELFSMSFVLRVKLSGHVI